MFVVFFFFFSPIGTSWPARRRDVALFAPETSSTRERFGVSHKRTVKRRTYATENASNARQSSDTLVTDTVDRRCTTHKHYHRAPLCRAHLTSVAAGVVDVANYPTWPPPPRALSPSPELVSSPLARRSSPRPLSRQSSTSVSRSRFFFLLLVFCSSRSAKK